METKTCPICSRPLGNDVNEHHLIPRTFKGKDTITLHRICHDALHRLISEREMQHHYHTVERLLEHEGVLTFVAWVRKKDPDFYMSMEESKDRKRKRRR